MSRRFLSFLFLIIPDALIFYASLWLAIAVRYHGNAEAPALPTYIGIFSLIHFLWLVVFFIHGLFELQSLRRYSTFIFNLVSAMAVNTLVAIIYFYLQRNLSFTPRRFLAVDVAIVFFLTLGWHLLVKTFIKNRLTQGVYLFSFNNELVELEDEVKKHEYLGYRVLGHLNEANLEQAQVHRDHLVILPDNLNTRPQALAKFYTLRTRGATFYNYKDFYELLLRRVYLSQLNEIWFLENIDYKEKRFYNLMKRLVDLLCGIVVLVVFAVTYPILAALITAGSPGPALFSQERVGKNGKIFKIYKYRTMDKATYTTWTTVNDRRITPIGKILRKTRLDELPQSINLIRGDVSLVGPRPEQPGIVADMRGALPFYDERHLVKPGLTGWAVINNIYAGNIEETKLKLQYDLYYIKHRSFLFDLEIILKTLYYIFTWQGR